MDPLTPDAIRQVLDIPRVDEKTSPEVKQETARLVALTLKRVGDNLLKSRINKKLSTRWIQIAYIILRDFNRTQLIDDDHFYRLVSFAEDVLKGISNDISAADVAATIYRVPTNAEIDELLDWNIRMAFLTETHNLILASVKDILREELRVIKMCPLIRPALKQRIIFRLYKALIPPGEPVGILTAQSAMAPVTQAALNSNHNISSGKDLGSGVTRLNETFELTKNRALPIDNIHFNDKFLTWDNVYDLRSSYVGLKVGDVIIAKETRNDLWSTFVVEPSQSGISSPFWLRGGATYNSALMSNHNGLDFGMSFPDKEGSLLAPYVIRLIVDPLKVYLAGTTMADIAAAIQRYANIDEDDTSTAGAGAAGVGTARKTVIGVVYSPLEIATLYIFSYLNMTKDYRVKDCVGKASKDCTLSEFKDAVRRSYIFNQLIISKLGCINIQGLSEIRAVYPAEMRLNNYFMNEIKVTDLPAELKSIVGDTTAVDDYNLIVRVIAIPENGIPFGSWNGPEPRSELPKTPSPVSRVPKTEGEKTPETPKTPEIQKTAPSRIGQWWRVYLNTVQMRVDCIPTVRVIYMLRVMGYDVRVPVYSSATAGATANHPVVSMISEIYIRPMFREAGSDAPSPLNEINQRIKSVERIVREYAAYQEELERIASDERRGITTAREVAGKLVPTPYQQLVYDHSRYVYAQTIGSNIREILKRPEVDSRYTFSNSFVDIEELLDVEALRNFLLREIYIIFVSQDTLVHSSIPLRMASHMSISGTAAPLTHSGLKKLGRGVLSKASMERPLDFLTVGAAFGLFDTVREISTAIIVGAKVKVGTNAMKIDVIPPSELNMIPLDTAYVFDEEKRRIDAGRVKENLKDRIKELAKPQLEDTMVLPEIAPFQVTGVIPINILLPPPIRTENMVVPAVLRGLLL